MIYALLLFSQLIFAQDASVTGTSSETLHLENEAKTYKKIIVSDDVEDFVSNPATPQRVSKEKLDLYKYTDVNRVLRQTAGVYVREEDGQGLRPNIGLRGTNPDRSKKVVILEDGILSGPAPYSAPAAYYTPSMNHTQSMEIYKGFTAVPFGPNSIGGSVNYLSLEIPTTLTAKIEASTGAFNTQNYRGSIGDMKGPLGYIVQVSRLSSDGFKQLDGGEKTGFSKNEFSARLKTHIAPQQDLEARLGFSNEDSRETYLGLSVKDIAQNPYRRYRASEADDMSWEHSKVELEHSYQISQDAILKSTIYRHDFSRKWHRLDSFRQTTTSGPPSLYDIVNQPQNFPVQYQILTGSLDSSQAGLGGVGDLSLLDNQRSYYSQGAQTKLNGQYNWGSTSHDVELGLRFHQDQIRRTHMENIYRMTSGHLVATDVPSQPKDMNSVNATATTLNFLENLKWRDFVFTALGRLETVRFDYDNLLTNQKISRSDSVFAPGIGLLYNLNHQWSIKTSVNRGVSVAGLDDTGNEAKEDSINYEAGLKFVSQDLSQQVEVIAFFNDYSNITGTCSSSTGCTNEQQGLEFNGGRAAIWGLEGRASQSFGLGPVNIPLQFNITLLNAEFKNTFSSTTAEWGVGQVDQGDPLPYIPQVQYTFSVGAEYKKLKNELAFIYQGESFDQSVSENRLKIPAYGIIDWTGKYEVSKKMQVFARADNLLGKDYIVSYKPYGARPGKPQSFMVGLNYVF